MASSNIKLFDENKGNMLSDSEFNISTQRLNGLQTGVASSQLQNKAMYQASLVAYAIAQIMMQNGKNANDTDAVSTFVANLSGTMLQKVYDLASTAEAQAGVATGKWMSPALVKAAIDALAAKAQNILSDTTKTLYGLDPSAAPNDAFVEIMRQLSEKVNPNLLGNWYFGNPVDQRNGLVAPKGFIGYEYPNETHSYGAIGRNMPIVEKVNEQWYKAQDDGGMAYVKAEEVVRGYGGKGFTIDMWYMGSYSIGSAALLFENDCIRLISAYIFRQKFENAEQLAGKTVTVSMMLEGVTTGTGQLGLVNQNGWVGNVVSLPLSVGEKTVISTTVTMPENTTSLEVYYYGSNGTDYKVYGAKLELGDQQTLAHQDANGNWVLNEIPDYGEQLARCQRYFTRIYIPSNAFIPISMYGGELNKAHFNIRLPTTMRQKPSCTFNGTGRIVTSGGQAINVTSIYDQEDGTTTDAIASTIEFEALPSGMSGWFDGRGSNDFYIDAIADL